MWKMAWLWATSIDQVGYVGKSCSAVLRHSRSQGEEVNR